MSWSAPHPRVAGSRPTLPCTPAEASTAAGRGLGPPALPQTAEAENGGADEALLAGDPRIELLRTVVRRCKDQCVHGGVQATTCSSWQTRS